MTEQETTLLQNLTAYVQSVWELAAERTATHAEWEAGEWVSSLQPEGKEDVLKMALDGVDQWIDRALEFGAFPGADSDPGIAIIEGLTGEDAERFRWWKSQVAALEGA